MCCQIRIQPSAIAAGIESNYLRDELFRPSNETCRSAYALANAVAEVEAQRVGGVTC